MVIWLMGIDSIVQVVRRRGKHKIVEYIDVYVEEQIYAQGVLAEVVDCVVYLSNWCPTIRSVKNMTSHMEWKKAKYKSFASCWKCNLCTCTAWEEI